MRADGDPDVDDDVNIEHSHSPAGLEARQWVRKLNRYREPNAGRAIAELAITALPLVALWVAAWLVYSTQYWWLSLLFATVAGAFLVRLFLIQHDCGHGAFFPRRSANNWVGRIISVATLTPYDVWRRTHGMHHASSGNLDRHGIGDIHTLTVSEYRARSRLGRLKYRLYRNPLVIFGLGPAYVFLLRQRLPIGLMRNGLQPWLATMGTNGVIALAVVLLVWLFGFEPFVLIHATTVMLAASVGVWLFYMQHQFAETTWSDGQRWNLHEAALHGSSHYEMPGVLRWFTANIGIHHVHHLCSHIPYYRLPRVLRDYPALANVGRITLLNSLRCIHLALWDEDKQRLVSFREATRQPH